MKIIIESKNEDGQIELSNREHYQTILLQATNENNDTVSMLLDIKSAEELEQALSTMRCLINNKAL